MGAGAGELLSLLTHAVHRRLTLGAIADQVFAYPTMIEAIRRAANLSRREALAGWSGPWLRRIVRWGR